MKLYVHLKGLLPKLADVVGQYSTTMFFETEYGVDGNGNFTSGHKEVDVDEEHEDDSDDANADCEGPATSYKSRRL